MRSSWNWCGSRCTRSHGKRHMPAVFAAIRSKVTVCSQPWQYPMRSIKQSAKPALDELKRARAGSAISASCTMISRVCSSFCRIATISPLPPSCSNRVFHILQRYRLGRFAQYALEIPDRTGRYDDRELPLARLDELNPASGIEAKRFAHCSRNSNLPFGCYRCRCHKPLQFMRSDTALL